MLEWDSVVGGKFKWEFILGGALALWVGYRCWDYYLRPLSDVEIKTASPDRLAVGLGDPSRRETVANRLLESGRPGWNALTRALRSPDPGVRLLAAQCLLTLRVPELETGIKASFPESDARVRDVKMAALASNGSRKVLPMLADYVLTAKEGANQMLGLSVAVAPFARLAASVTDAASVPALQTEKASHFESAYLALADIDPAVAEKFALDRWPTLAASIKRKLAPRLPELATAAHDPILRAYMAAIEGRPDELLATDLQTGMQFLQTAPERDFVTKGPLRTTLLTVMARYNPARAALLSYFDPDPEVAAMIARQEAANPGHVGQENLGNVRVVNGDLTVEPKSTSPYLTVDYLLAVARRRDISALPALRKSLARNRQDVLAGALNAFVLAQASSDKEDQNLVYRFLLVNKGRWDMWSIEAALSFKDGETMLRQAIDAIDPTDPLGQQMVLLMQLSPTMQKREDLQQLVVAKCATMPWEQIKYLDPRWCRKFGDDDMKEKYAVLLGNHRYAGRITDLICFAQTGHAKTLDELNDTAGRGMIDEIITCIELAGEEEFPGDRLAYILKYKEDKRWRVREAVVYALRRLGTPEALQTAASYLSDPSPVVQLTAKLGDAYVSHHFAVSPRPDITSLATPIPVSGITDSTVRMPAVVAPGHRLQSADKLTTKP